MVREVAADRKACGVGGEMQAEVAIAALIVADRIVTFATRGIVAAGADQRRVTRRGRSAADHASELVIEPQRVDIPE